MTLLVYIMLEEQCIRESVHDAYKNNVHNFRGTMYIRECAHDAYKNNKVFSTCFYMYVYYVRVYNYIFDVIILTECMYMYIHCT